MDELVEVEEVVADNHRKTTKFGVRERETPNTLCQVKHAARSFFWKRHSKIVGSSTSE